MTTGPSGVLLVLLVAGHLLGDFALQTESMARSKRSPGVLLTHLGAVAAAHLTALGPLLTWPLVLVVLGITVSHGAIDLWKSGWTHPRPGVLGLFVLDQAGHLLILLAVWAGFLHWAGSPRSLLPPPSLDAFTTAAAMAAALAFNAVGGGAIVSGVLGEKDPAVTGEVPDAAGSGAGRAGSGRLIGILERTLSLILILVGQWATIGILITAKSIARFDELKERRFSEYYLIGTLTSILVAIVTGLLLMSALGRI